MLSEVLFQVIVIVISKLLKRHSKAKRRAPAYSQVMGPECLMMCCL